MYGGIGITYIPQTKQHIPDAPVGSTRKIPTQRGEVWTPDFEKNQKDPYNTKYINAMHDGLIALEREEPDLKKVSSRCK